MVRAWQVIADRFGRAVLDDEAGVVAEHRVTHSRFDADARRAAGDDQICRGALSEDLVQVGLEEAAKAVLRDTGITCLRLQLVKNLRVPCVRDENPACGAVRGRDLITDAQGRMLEQVGAVDRTGVREVCRMLHRDVDDRDHRRPRRRDDAGGGRRRSADTTDVDPCTVEHSSGCPEVVLHVYYKDGCPLEIDLERGRATGDRDHAPTIHPCDRS